MREEDHEWGEDDTAMYDEDMANATGLEKCPFCGNEWHGCICDSIPIPDDPME